MLKLPLRAAGCRYLTGPAQPSFSPSYKRILQFPFCKRHFVYSCNLRSNLLPPEMTTVNTEERLKAIREKMKENGFDVYIVPSEDAHQSEYLAPCDRVREHICGFSGSAGTAVITLDKAAMATDGRYFNQAEKQLDSNWELLKQGLEDVPSWQDWAANQCEGGKVVGVDSTVITAGSAKKLKDKIVKKGGKDLKGITKNLVAEIWHDRPARPAEKIKVHPELYSGQPIHEKLENLRNELEKKNCSGIVISMLDEIAWLYNLRGNDIPYNPVFFSYAVVTPNDAFLFIDSNKLDDEVHAHLDGAVKIKPYDAVFGDLEAFQQAAASDTENARKFGITNQASWALSEALGGKEKTEEMRSPVGDAKSVKNSVELQGMRDCHVRDGAALSEYFAWLEDQLLNQNATLDEVDAADKLEQIRGKHERFVGLSFDTISSTGPNAAVIHYKPEKGICSKIDPKAVYLCDSGGQYLDGTTDTTRTLHFGEPTEMERKAYTLVLKGVIALDKAVFPKGTNGMALDTLARQFLWEEGLDYRHGTGHGVGSYLNVHEGPIGIGTRVQYTEVPLAIGNVISDEPGYYEDGNFGIRIENMIMACEIKTNHNFGDKQYIGFECVTMTPMCRKLTDVSLLSSREKKWLNDYHATVWEKTKGFFEGKDEITLKWLKRETQPW